MKQMAGCSSTISHFPDVDPAINIFCHLSLAYLMKITITKEYDCFLEMGMGPFLVLCEFTMALRETILELRGV